MADDSIKQGIGFGFTPIGKIKDKRAKYLVKDILLKGVFSFISAHAKAGKTTLALYLAICLTTGRLFLNRYFTRKCKVLYICLEDNFGEVKEKVKYMLKGRRFPKHLYLLNAKALDLPSDFQKLALDIKELEPDVVIFDTLRRSHKNEESSSSEMASILNEARKLIRELKFTGLFIHHAGHEIKNKSISGDWLRGTSDFDGVWEVLLGITKHRDKTDMKVFHKYRPDLELSYKVIYGEAVDEYTGCNPIIDLDYFNADIEAHTEEENLIIDNLRKDSASANSLEDIFKGRLSRPKIDAALERLQHKDKIIRKDKGKNTKWQLAA